MAATVTDDFTTIKDMENTTGVVQDDSVVGSTGSTSTIFFVQGSNSVIGQFKASGVGGMGFQYAANQDWRQRHVMGWVNNLDVAQVDGAAAGWRLRLESVGDSGSWGTNYGEWFCGGRDTLNVFVDRFLFLCADVMRPFDASAGTLNRNAARTFGVVTNATSGSGQSTWFLDELKYGTGITVTAGTVGVPGVSADILSSDRSNGRGTFKDANGAFAITGGIEIGDTGTASSYFVDLAESWFFENLPVANHFHNIVLQGNATGTNNIIFGTKTGTGVNEEASGGNVFASAGDVPFQVSSIDSNVDEAGFYGCTFLGPAALRDDPLRNFLQEDNSGGPSFVDLTDEANDATANDAQPFPSGAGNNDAAYFGSDRIFAILKVNTGTAGAGTYTVTWEYYNGTSWASLTDVTDGTGAFKTTGTQTVSYAVPDDWTTVAVNSFTRFWVRARRDAGTVTTNPDLTQCWVSQGGNVRLETANTKAIRTIFSQMETIRIRNGAFLKKSVITDSISPLKHAAIDLGSSDPTANTLRDLTIANCNKGLLLKGTSTGTTAYNLRNIQFSNNTNDIRVDFPSAATVDINILEGGNTPTIDNVNSSTVNVNNVVTVRIEGLTEGAAATFIANETVGTITTGDVILQGLANSSGVLETASFNYEAAFDPSGLDVIVRARQQGLPNAAIADDNGAFTDQTTNANSATTNDMNLLPATPVANQDRYLFGHNEEFGGIKIDVTTAGTGGFTITWQYWNGAWTNLSGVVDNTNSFSTLGENKVTWTIPGDWADTTINGQGPFRFVRAAYTAGTVTVVPLARKATLDVTRYIPFDQNRTITSSGLSVVASWVQDTIATF